MNRQAMERLEENRVAIGQSFSSFNALCRFLGIVAKKGGRERKYIEKRLRCYFDWERLPSSNRLIITEVFYDNPKPYVDERRGIHTTAENEPMQNLILLTPELFSTDYTERGILIKMKLINQEEPSGYRTSVYQDYKDRLSDLLESALTQLTKRGYISTRGYLCALKTGYVLTQDEENCYGQIIGEVLREFKVPSIRIVNLQGRGEQFWKEVNRHCQEQLGRSYIGRRYHLELHDRFAQKRDLLRDIAGRLPLETEERDSLLEDPESESILRNMERSRLLERMMNGLAENYAVGHEGAIGVVSPQRYRQDLDEIRKSLFWG